MIPYRTRILVGVAIAVIAGSAIVLAFVEYLPQQAGPAYSWVENGSVVSGGNCTQAFPGGLPVTEYAQNKSIVFLMKPNTTAQICVSYRVLKADLTSPVTNGPMAQFQFAVTKLHFECTTSSCAGSGTPGPFNLSASPNYITINPGNHVARVVIVYTIQSFSNSVGLYGLEYLNSCLYHIPFAVGYQPSQVNSSDFVGFFAFFDNSCGGPNYFNYLDYLSNGNITGITNLSYTYISAEFNTP